ncbi:MAG: RtcB family protein [Thermoplasmatota archaeon]
MGNGVHEIPADYRGQDGNLRMRVPGRVVADGDLLPHIMDDQALEQVANVASLPGIVGASLAMPDIHWGYGFPIGGVAAFDLEEGVVSPGGVGFDINCGVRLLRTDLMVDDIRNDLPAMMDQLFAAAPAGMGSRGDLRIDDAALDDILERGAYWARDHGLATDQDLASMEDGGCIPGAAPELISDRARLRGKRSLGSLGSGNHFLELQVVDQLWDADAASRFGVQEGQLVVMIHTGSRGLGHQVCQEHVQALQSTATDHGIDLPDRQLACAPLASQEAQDYLGAMNAAANFAFVNRSAMATVVRDVLEPLGGRAETLYDVCHNIAKVETHRVDGEQRKVCVHRKGATRAFPAGHDDVPEAYRAVGQPVMVPGDMGRQSFLLAGSPGAMETSFGSSCHGAGRRMSRTEAKRRFGGQQLIDELAKQGILVRATSQNVAAEEAPEAYKDVSQVVQSVENAGLARRVARMRPLGVVKG